MILWTVNWWRTHILSVLQEVLQVSVVLELLWHLLGSSFILVMPEGQTQNREEKKTHEKYKCRLRKICLHLLIKHLCVVILQDASQNDREETHSKKIPDMLTQHNTGICFSATPWRKALTWRSISIIAGACLPSWIVGVNGKKLPCPLYYLLLTLMIQW